MARWIFKAMFNTLSTRVVRVYIVQQERTAWMCIFFFFLVLYSSFLSREIQVFPFFLPGDVEIPDKTLFIRLYTDIDLKFNQILRYGKNICLLIRNEKEKRKKSEKIHVFSRCRVKWTVKIRRVLFFCKRDL